MSTQSLAPRRQGSKYLLAFSLLSGLLITWLTLSSTAFAAQLLPDSPSGTQQGLLRAGVSVVRLLVTYEKADNSGPVYCTGLGAIVASWSVQNSSDQNSWVLTDSSLVNGNQALCADGHPKATLSSIEVYLSTAYNQQTITFQSIGPVTCQDGGDCHSGSALFALGRTQGQLLPFIDLAQQQSPPNQDMAIQLTTNAGLASTSSTSTPSSLPIPSITASNSSDASTFQVQAEKFLTPSEISPTNTLEAGTPLINTNGQLTSLHLADASSQQTSTNIQSFISKTIPSFKSHSANNVHDGWQRGMDAYSNKDFTKAHTEFQIAADANPNFQAAKDFAVSSLNLENSNNSGQSNSSNTITIAGVSIPLWQLVIVIVLLLAVVLLVITLLLGRSRQRSLEADLEEAARRATIDAPQIAEMERAKAQQIAEIEAAQRATTQQSLYEQPIQHSPVLVPTQPGAGPVALSALWGTRAQGRKLLPQLSLAALSIGIWLASTSPGDKPACSVRSLAGRPADHATTTVASYVCCFNSRATNCRDNTK